MLKWKLAGAAVLGAFVLAGPLQHVGAIPQTAVGDASKSTLKAARDFVIGPAFAACVGDVGGGGGIKPGKGNNGFGNGGRDGVPGRSVHQDITR
jgi:hypothetical protein